MAMAFQKMLERFGLMDKIHAVNTDNALPNDKQMTKLTVLDNSFEKDNHVRCFNHTMQLSAKTLLAPFNTAISQKATQDDKMPEEDDDQLILEGDDEDEEEDNAQGSEDEDDGIGELDELSESEQAGVLKSTAVVRETVTMVRNHETENVRFLDTLLIVGYPNRYDNLHLRSFIQQQLPFLRGATPARNSTSRRGSSLVTL